MTRRAVLLASALAALVRATGADAADTVELSGRYRFSGGHRERKAISKAIEDAVADTSFTARPTIQRRLKVATRVHSTIRIAIDDDTITIQLGNEVYRARADGEPIRLTGGDGEEIELRMRVTENALEQSLSTEDGGRDNTFRGIVGMKKMRLAVRIHSEKLPKDLKYQLTYTRR